MSEFFWVWVLVSWADSLSASVLIRSIFLSYRALLEFIRLDKACFWLVLSFVLLASAVRKFLWVASLEQAS